MGLTPTEATIFIRVREVGGLIGEQRAMHIAALVVARIWLDLAANPVLATVLGATFAGHPEFAAELVEICKRESPGNECARTVGLHPNNRISDVRRAYTKAISYKYLYLHPGCAEHVVDAGNDAEVMRYGVRGSLSLIHI